MQTLDSILEKLMFALVTLVLLGAPWLFGAWEMWWFWPFTVGLLLATGCLGARLALSASLGSARLRLTSVGATALFAFLPFLTYAIIRAVQTDAHMDAERSLLLHLTPVLLGLIIVLGMRETRRRTLLYALAVNFLLLGLYGIANDFIAGNAHVLWVPGFPQYQLGYPRATGSYFCPDHFSGLMELALCLSLAIVLAPSTPAARRIGILPLLGVSLYAIMLSKSRGGGLIAGLVLVCGLWWGTAAWSARPRRTGRIVGVGTLAALLVLLVLFGGHYVKRFKEYPWVAFEQSDRYQMSVATLRGWQSAPIWGIGPGMHQNLWPHFAPSLDGDREKGIWPRFLNNYFHSFESHNDWFQLLEEYGAVGMALFLLATGTTVFLVGRGWVHLVRRRNNDLAPPASGQPDWIVLAGLLAITAMAGHSIGDFNLQMPASTWLLAALVGNALASVANSDAHASERRRHRHGASEA